MTNPYGLDPHADKWECPACGWTLTHHGGGIDQLPDRHYTHDCNEHKETEQ